MALTYNIIFSSSTNHEWNLDNDDINIGKIEITNSATNNYQTGMLEVNNPPSSLSIGDDVSVYINDSIEFSGYITRTQHTIAGINKYNVQLIGKTYDLWRYNIDDTAIHTLNYDWTTSLVRDLVSSQCDGDIGYTDIIPGSGVFISGSYEFDNYSVGDAIKQLSNYDGFQFYVNSGNNLQYYELSSTQAITITEAEIEKYSPFQQSDDMIYNDVIVVGNGISVRSSSQASIDKYGRHRYRFNESSISGLADAQLIADNIVSNYKNPDLYGEITVIGNEDIDIGEKITLDLTNLSITGNHNIKSYTHTIDENGFRTKVSFGRESYDPSTDYAVLRAGFDSSYKGVFDALSNAASSQATADGALVSFFQDDEPAGVVSSEGDIWFDTNDDNKIYVYSGSNWEVGRDSGIAKAIASSATAQSTADGKIVTFYQDAQPTADGTGDLWVDTNDANKLWRWNGSSWEDARSDDQHPGDYTTDQNHSVLNNIGASDHHDNYVVGGTCTYWQGCTEGTYYGTYNQDTLVVATTDVSWDAAGGVHRWTASFYISAAAGDIFVANESLRCDSADDVEVRLVATFLVPKGYEWVAKKTTDTLTSQWDTWYTLARLETDV